MKKTQLLTILLICLGFATACSNAPQTENTQDSASMADNQLTPPTDEEIFDLIGMIPDHSMNDSPEWAFTDEYYSALKEAWAVPNDCPGELGSNEWLFYFVTGNGDVGYDHVENIVTTMNGDKAAVKFECVYPYPEMPHSTHQLQLVHNGKRWVVADYDNTLKLLLEYIQEQRAYFRSEKWSRDLDSFEHLSATEKKVAQEDVDNYFKHYPKDRK